MNGKMKGDFQMEEAQLDELRGKNWVAAFALSIVVGMLGGHRFYTGKKTTAWIMLALTLGGFITCGITSLAAAIWWLIDTVALALGKWSHEDGSPLYEVIPWLGYTYIGFLVLQIIVAICYIVFGAAIVGAGLGAGS